MAIPTLFHDERVIIFGIAVASITTFFMMKSVLANLVEDNLVEPVQPKTQYITQETEDSLQLETLEKLVGHPSYSVREISIKILSDRAVNDAESMNFLLRGITQSDYDHRLKCLRALALLMRQNIDSLGKLHNPRAYAAFVGSLEVGLDDVPRPKLNNSSWDEYHLRDMAERFCLMFIYELVSKNLPDMLVQAKFVEKWLAKQDWGDTEEEMQRNFREYRKRKSNRIRDLIEVVWRSKSGRAALQGAKLIPKDEGGQENGQSRVVLNLAQMGEVEALERLEREVRRNREHSAEEQRLRRQHREAMVFNDGTRPVGRDDIIQVERERDGPPF